MSFNLLFSFHYSTGKIFGLEVVHSVSRYPSLMTEPPHSNLFLMNKSIKIKDMYIPECLISSHRFR